MKEILVTLNLEQRHKVKLESAAPGCSFVYAPGDALTKEMVQRAQIIIGNPRLVKSPSPGVVPDGAPVIRDAALLHHLPAGEKGRDFGV